MGSLIKSLKVVFIRPSYIILALAFSFLIFLVSIWLPSWESIKFFIISDFFSIGVKIKILAGTLGLIKTNFNLVSAMIVIALSILSGINMAMFIFYLKRRITLQKSANLGFIGIVSGLLGVGCASCGSVVLSTIIGLSATTSFIGILPFGGHEFGILGLAVIILSIYLIGKKIPNPLLCRI